MPRKGDTACQDPTVELEEESGLEPRSAAQGSFHHLNSVISKVSHYK